MGREIAKVSENERGDEVHPAFGMIQANRVSQGPTGAVLFDSDVQHHHYVTLKIMGATRKRDLHRDWIHESGQYIEVAMSEAQWAGLISSMNTTGTPCTLRWLRGEGQVPGLSMGSRLDKSHEEVRTAADDAMAKVKEARDTYEAHKTAKNLRDLHYAIENLPSTLEFAAKSLSEHAETVVQKTRADMEAMVYAAAEQAGVAPPRYTPLEGEGDEPKELEG